MMDGFDLSSPLVCEGVVGDGCGGGRIFFVEKSTLFAYDPMSKNKIPLLKNLVDVVKISKKACIISLQMKERSLNFDLSKLR